MINNFISTLPLAREITDLHMVWAQQIAGGVANGGKSQPIIYLRLQQGEFCLGEPCLGIKNEEVCFCTQLKFALLRRKSLLSKIVRSGAGSERLTRLFKLLHCIVNFAGDLLLNLSAGIEI